jgi:hypothetical protein
MNKGRVGEDRGSKETDGCPLTVTTNWQNQYVVKFRYLLHLLIMLNTIFLRYV